MICVLFTVTWAHEEDSLQWLQDYYADDKLQCCGRNDCVRAEIQVLEKEGGHWKVRINGKVIEIASSAVYPSEDTYGYYCYQFSSQRVGDDWFLAQSSRSPSLCNPTEISFRCFRCLFYPVGN